MILLTRFIRGLQGRVNKLINRPREIAGIYQIDESRYLASDREYRDPNVFPLFQTELQEFKQKLIDFHQSRIPLTLYKFGDGDYNFLKQVPVGSAQPGKRALSLDYGQIDMNKFIEGSKKCDLYVCEILNRNRKLFTKDFEGKEPDYPAEFLYGLLANRWLLKNLGSKIGLIGANSKISIVKRLMEHPQYQEYLGISEFTDFISIPQKYACDNVEEVSEAVRRQLEISTSEVFLVGVGHVKSGLLHRLPNFRSAIYLDVGSGIDALAGIVDPYRPYFADWQNFRLRDPELYDAVDYLQYSGGNEVYI